MKRILSGLFAITALSLFITGCTKTAPTNNITRVFGYNLTVAPGEWTQDKNNARHFLSGQDINLINENVRDYGAVLVYFSFQPGGFEDAGPLPAGNHTFYSRHENGIVHFTAEYTANETPVKPDYPVYVKIVVIPATDAGKLSNIPNKNYNAVKATFNLKD